MRNFTRRIALKIFAAATACVGIGKKSLKAQERPTRSSRIDAWDKTPDRVFLGGEFWANPMEDWRVAGGAAECQTGGGDRNIHLLTHQLTNTRGAFAMSVRVARVDSQPVDTGAGFRVGIRSELNEHRSNCFAKNGINAGLVQGRLVLGDESALAEEAGTEIDSELELTLVGTSEGSQYRLELTASNQAGKRLATLTTAVPSEALLGNVALVSNFEPNAANRNSTPKQKEQGSRYRFHDWRVGGDALSVTEENRFGPILWSMYSLSDSRSDEGFVMKVSAIVGPLGEDDNKEVALHVKRGADWTLLGNADLDTDAWVATFRIPNWNEKQATPYKLVYRQRHTTGSEEVFEWSGIIRSNPTGRPLRLAALTCQNDYGFPYEPVAENVRKLDPDMAYFSGDQLYEGHGGYGLIRDPAGPAILNYLRKYYQFGWSFRHAIKDRPTICIPDDHDVFQGNIWGEGGAKMKDIASGTSSKGGYREPARMVNVVHKTNAAHHPDYYDPTPVKQGISVYYGDMVYGGVSFAILGDRQFKSGPERVETGSGRADHVRDRDFDTSALNQPGLVLLGERQENFLRHWAGDWKGHSMKVLLSQTVFAGVATHHGRFDGYLKADLDSGGWPQTARDRAIDILRQGMPLHINGDQHLTTLVQYGTKSQRDGCWSFCTPAIAAGYPRWWRPDDLDMPHEERPEHGLPNTGEFLDGFGNKAYVYAVGNPEVGRAKNRYDRAHQKGSGFGLVTIDTQAKTYTIESFRFLIDATDGKPSNQFPGWPVTIQQRENAGDNVLG